MCKRGGAHGPNNGARKDKIQRFPKFLATPAEKRMKILNRNGKPYMVQVMLDGNRFGGVRQRTTLQDYIESFPEVQRRLHH